MKTTSSLLARRADSRNGFDFGDLNYNKYSRMQKIFQSARSKNNTCGMNDDDDDPIIINVPYSAVRPGYPKSSYMNITVTKMNDEDDFGKLDDKNDKDGKQMSEDMEDQLRRLFNIPQGVRLYKVADTNMSNKRSEAIRDEIVKKENKKSENFELVEKSDIVFNDVGGYDSVKDEMMQTIDILKNFEKYQNYSIRTPKGLLLEGPPGNGKTLLAKAFSGEVNSSFIPVSGSQFTEKYVGVGASRIRELFKLAKENIPCIIFIDEIDALGRSRASSEQNNNPNVEAQSTLNELLVSLDGYQSTEGIFVIAATNRADLLDNALLRPGRIDKKIYIGNPDAKTRERIIEIHKSGKPCEQIVENDDLVEMTNGLSGAQIENLLNEAMLHALRLNRTAIARDDLDTILSRMLVGYQSTENSYSDDMIHRIAIHELGHAIVGLFSLHHAKLVKICLNTWSPTSPGYTIFESAETDASIYTKERLNSRLMVLLAGRIAEEIFFGASITSGASKDIESAYTLAEQMIVKFGMGRKIVYPHHSESSKNFIDKDIEILIEGAYSAARNIIVNKKGLIEECANELIEKKILVPECIIERMN